MSTNVVIPSGVTQASFDAAFKAAQPKAVQEFMANPARTQTQALALANEGYVIDLVTMYWGWDAYQQTVQRLSLGYAWVPAANQPPVTLAPGLQLPGYQPYEPGVIPAGAIIVTLNESLLASIYAPAPGSIAAQQVAAEAK
jgi:hypothetical protein